MNRLTMGKLFYIAIFLGLVFNLLGDLSVYRENKIEIEIETGQWVQQSYEILQDIDRQKIKIYESQISGGPKNSEEIARLSQMAATERGRLDERLKRDVDSNNTSVFHIIAANLLDLTLMLVVCTFFLYERRVAVKMQGAMTLALAHLESVNHSLLKKMSKKDSKLKATVHDLKNPLGSIRGFAELLQDEAGNSRSTMELVEYIKRISNNTLNLVESMLQSEEEEEDKLREDVSVFGCLEETCLFLEPIARSKKQTIVINRDAADFLVFASKQKIQDVFYNLLSNALKYSPASSSVFVSCAQAGAYHAVIVKDQGPGFQKEDFPKMFLPGARLSAKPTAGEHSSGLGLYSAKITVESIKGKIEIRNNRDGGATVIVKFPIPGAPRLV